MRKIYDMIDGKIIYEDEVKPKEKQYGHPRFHELLDEIRQLHSEKNFDYAEGGSQGALGNFHRISAIAKLYPESPAWGTATGVALTYMLKQLDAALMMLTTGKKSKTGEPIGSRLRDIAIYALIAMIIEEEASK